MSFLHKTGILLLAVIFLLMALPVHAGDYTAIHYDRSNGLPGNFGYYLYQDRKGYLWIGTENGLARFNGYEFKVYTTKDGLIDNEVLIITGDHAGRVWLSPFSYSLCYIDHDKVYSMKNDTRLRHVLFSSRPGSIGVDRNDNVLTWQRDTLWVIGRNGTIRKILFPGGDAAKGLKNYGEHLVIFFNGALYSFDGTAARKIVQLPVMGKNYQYSMLMNIWMSLGPEKGTDFIRKALSSGLPVYDDKVENSKLIGVERVSGGRLAMTRVDGCFIADIATAKIVDTFLYGYRVAPCIVSSDSAIWLGTHGSGIFRFINSPVKSLGLSSSVQYIRAQENGMYGILEKDMMVSAAAGRQGQMVVAAPEHFYVLSPYQAIVYMGKNRDGKWILASGSMYQYDKLSEAPVAHMESGSCKDVFEEDEDHLLVASGSRLIRVNRHNMLSDTLLDSRVTSVVKSGGVIYTGTLDGLWAGTEKGNFRNMFSGAPVLNRHILKLCNGQGNDVWVATNNAELCVINDNRLLAVIGEKDGLQCNRISALCISSQFIWAGTDNGMYAIRNRPPFRVVRHLSQASGLNSNQVTCLDVYGNKVWAGTDHGINYFDEQEVFRSQPLPNMIINSITNGGEDVMPSNKMMSLRQKTLTVDFDVIDHVGGQKPKFEYCLNSDSTWTTIENSNLYFPSIPYGDVTIHLRASSPNWERPVERTLKFYRSYPFYLQWWFLTIVSLLFAGAITIGVVLFLRRARRKDQEKLSVQRNLLQLEQMALQGQMNPHFIFNCIAAIKQYYSLGDMQKAHRFVDVFASLIRQTFEMGTETFVSMDKELNYLSKYLSIEQARFDHSFDFFITKKLSLPDAQIPVPAMLLQPIAENAVRHGVRHLSGRRGIINIVVTQSGDRVEITITDNGVGREKSRRFGHMFRDMTQVTSTTVNTKRIDILNRLFEQQIVHITEDVTDEHNQTAGTRVIISYPLDIQKIQYRPH